VRVTVEDYGRGIDPKNIDRIFDAFFTTKSDNMGMGVSICRSTIESHGGCCKTCKASARSADSADADAQQVRTIALGPRRN